MRYVCSQIVHQTDEPLQIFLVLLGMHLAYVFYFARVWPDSIRAIHRPGEYDLAGLDSAFLRIDYERPYTTTSSAMPTQPGALARIRSKACWNGFWDTHKQNGSIL